MLYSALPRLLAWNIGRVFKWFQGSREVLSDGRGVLEFFSDRLDRRTRAVGSDPSRI